MTPSVNLLPAECLHEWTRARRLQIWIVAAGVSLALALGAFLVRLPSGQAVRQLSTRVEQNEREHQALNGSLQAATAQQAELVRRLRLIVGLERREPWPQRLATLARLMPEGIVLTALSAEPQAAPPAASLPDRAGRGSGPEPASAQTAGPVPPTNGAGSPPSARQPAGNRATGPAHGALASRPAPAEPPPAMQIKGLAATQEELMTLLERLERSGLWPRVELVLASRQVSARTVATGPGRTGVVAFEIRCYTPGEAP